VVVIRSKPLPADEMTMNAATNTNTNANANSLQKEVKVVDGMVRNPFRTEAESFEKGGRGEPERSSRKIFNFKFLIQTLNLKQPQEDIGHYDTEELVESGTFENSRDRVCVWIGRVRLPPLDRFAIQPQSISFYLLLFTIQFLASIQLKSSIIAAMHLKLFTLFGSSATLLLIYPSTRGGVLVSADCLVEGDMMFMEGQSISHIGLECINATSYDATDSVCGPDGAIIKIDAVYTCPTTNINCIQCGERSEGAALCLDTTDIPSNCVDTTTATGSTTTSTTEGEGTSSLTGCLVGDIMYTNGQSTGHIGIECVNDTSYNAIESICSGDNIITETDAQFTCPEESSYCVQCGVVGEKGSALCLTSPEVPSDCATAVEPATSPTSVTVTSPATPTGSSSSGSVKKSGGIVASMMGIMIFSGSVLV
jgi:hypothetical protein